MAPLQQWRRAGQVRRGCNVSDWRLAEGDGVAAMAALRACAGQPLPALLISSHSLPQQTHQPQQLAALQISSARMPLPAPALRAWLSAPALV